jgi:alginate O-acetyltransferase complex protein AlgI
MLFNSLEFIFVFLPTVLLLALGVATTGQGRLMRALLLAASLVFYAWWDVTRLPLLLGTIIANHLLARLIWAWPATKPLCLTAGVLINVGMLAYFKYRGFLLGEVFGLPGIATGDATDSLPLGISFFTFQQLAWLFDSARAGAERTSLPTYALFVTFFPQLIAGPIVHHNELVPQLMTPAFGRIAHKTFAAGVSLFVIGLFKKVVLADFFAPTVDAAFFATSRNQFLQAGQAWTGLGAYACQIYFDFSGYSDMAMGLGLLFGVVLPANFASPYKAHDMADFWRRWHITLSRFLRDFVYIPLGGNRVGPIRQAFNLIATMTIGGLWHGAGYTFLLWGLLHGVLLAIVHAHRAALRRGLFFWPKLGRFAWAVTLVAVLFTWVPFRATTLASTAVFYRSLIEPLLGLVRWFGAGSLLPPLAVAHIPEVGDTTSAAVILGMLMCLALPASVEIFSELLDGPEPPLKTSTRLANALAWKPGIGWAIATGILAFFAVADLLSASPSAFLYFQF